MFSKHGVQLDKTQCIALHCNDCEAKQTKSTAVSVGRWKSRVDIKLQLSSCSLIVEKCTRLQNLLLRSAECYKTYWGEVHTVTKSNVEKCTMLQNLMWRNAQCYTNYCGKVNNVTTFIVGKCTMLQNLMWRNAQCYTI